MNENEYVMPGQIAVKTRNDDPRLVPELATSGAAGFDLRSANADAAIMPGGTLQFNTGVSLEIPAGFNGEVRSRSGMAFNHLVFIPQGIGTIDSDYRGEIKVLLHNAGALPYSVAKYDRIAQLVITRVYRPDLVLVDELSSTRRAHGGFGSTGKD